MTIERSTQRALILMAPVGGDNRNREADKIIDWAIWNRQTRSTMFKLPGDRDLPRCRFGRTG
jgi:hypothetical protein